MRAGGTWFVRRTAVVGLHCAQNREAEWFGSKRIDLSGVVLAISRGGTWLLYAQRATYQSASRLRGESGDSVALLEGGARGADARIGMNSAPDIMETTEMYWLGPFEYTSKKALLDGLKSYLQRVSVGVITNPHAIKKLHLLIAMHPDAERKIGVGVDHFKIKRNALGAGSGFWLVRSDGSEESFSYERCITGAVQSPHSKVCEALRFAVRDQMRAFRDGLGLPALCSVSGVDILKRKDLHIDHKYPSGYCSSSFARIAKSI